MVKECEHLKTCGFIQKYGATRDLACRGFIMLYCKGDKMKECKRLELKEKHGEKVNPDMMPNGQICKDRDN